MSLRIILPEYLRGLPFLPVGFSLLIYLRSASSLNLLIRCIPIETIGSTNVLLENHASATMYLDIAIRVSFLADITPAYQLVRLCSSVLSVCTTSRRKAI